MLHKDNRKPILEAFEFLDLVRLILEILRYLVTKIYCNPSMITSLAICGGVANLNQ